MVDKVVELGKSSATGSFHLMIGIAGSTIIMAVGTILLGMLLPAEGVGLYGMALIPSSIISFFRDWGINSAMTKQIANLRLEGKNAQIHDVIFSGVIFEILSGILLSVVCFAIAQPIAWIMSPQAAPQLSLYISVMSLSIFAGAIASAAGGIFIGYERMKLNSFTQICAAVIKTSLGPLLIVLGFGVLGAVYAAVISILAGGILSIVIVYYAIFRPLQKHKIGRCDIKQTLKPMLTFGLPLTASTIVTGVLPLAFALTMGIYAGAGDIAAGNPYGWTMGNYFTATNFTVLLTFVSFPVATALFPVFSKIDPEKEPHLIKTVFSSSVKYTAILLVPATMLLITLATPIVNTMFPQDGILNALLVTDATPKFPLAPIFLALSATVNLFVLIGNISLSTFQSGIGQTKQIMKQSLLSLATSLPLAYLLVAYAYSLGGPNGQVAATYAVVGGLIGAIAASMPGMIWGLIWSWRHYGVKADFAVSAKIFGASLTASIVAYLLISLVHLPYIVTLLMGGSAFLLIYLTTAPLLGAVNSMDIENFRTMFSGSSLVSKLLHLPLRYMQMMCRNTPLDKNTPTEIK